MKYKLIIPLLLFFYFIVFSVILYAYDIGFSFPTAMGGSYWDTTLATYTSCNDVRGTASSSAAGANVKFVFPNNTSFDIPEGWDYLDVQFDVDALEDYAGIHFTFSLGYSPAGDPSVNWTDLSSTDTEHDFTQTETSYVFHFKVENNATNRGYIEAGKFGLKIRKGSSTYTAGLDSQRIRIDCLQMAVERYIFTGSGTITSAEASASAQLIRMAITGDTGTCDVTRCASSITESCEATGVPSISQVIWGENDISNLDSTWCNPDDSEFDFVVDAPLHPAMDCSYSMAYLCYDENGDVVVSGDVDLGSPAEAQNQPVLTEPEPTDPLAWVVWKMKMTLIDLFVPKNVIYEWTALQSYIETKAPFGYILPVFQEDYSYSTNSTYLLGTLQFNINETPIDWALDFTSISGLVDTVHDIIEVIIWFDFILFLFFFFKSRHLP